MCLLGSLGLFGFGLILQSGFFWEGGFVRRFVFSIFSGIHRVFSGIFLCSCLLFLSRVLWVILDVGKLSGSVGDLLGLFSGILRGRESWSGDSTVAFGIFLGLW